MHQALLLRDGRYGSGSLRLNRLESQHVLAPARDTESSKSTPQQRKRRRLGDRIGTVAHIIHTDDIIIHVYRDAGNRLVSIGETDESGSATETGIGNVHRLARTLPQSE